MAVPMEEDDFGEEGLVRKALRGVDDLTNSVSEHLVAAASRQVESQEAFAQWKASEKEEAVEEAGPTLEEQSEVLSLMYEGFALRHDLQCAKQETQDFRSYHSVEAGRHAAAIARLERRQEAMAMERDSALERADQEHQRAKEAETHRDAVMQELQCARAEAKEVSERLESLNEELRKGQDLGVAGSGSAHLSMPASSAGESSNLAHEEELSALKRRIADLEAVNNTLMMSLKDAEPDRRLAQELRKEHEEYRRELLQLRGCKAELPTLKEEVSNLRRERSRLQSLVESKTRQIESLQEPARLANQTIADSEAFKLAAAAIVGASNPSAMDLNLAWARVQSKVNQLRRGQSEAERDLELAQKKERATQMDMNHLRNDLNQFRKTLEICELDKQKAQEITEGHEARVTVLREALKRGIPKEEAARLLAQDFAEELKLAQQKAKATEDVAAARKKAFEDLQGEVERLRSKTLRLSEAEAKAEKLERLNADLWASAQELEQQQRRLTAELEKRDQLYAELDFDPNTTKVIHLTRGPSQWAQASSTQQATADSSSARTGDLERRQAERQLDRFKKATKKYVQEFREGIYGLLGWKLEMKAAGAHMRWHLSSRYEAGRELIFQLRPGTVGRQAEFDMLSTEWAEELSRDAQAMAYLEVYRSIPGFLAAVTADLLSRRTAPN
mmetsp:Transcript_32569/g.69819  ORF Transcript_32569/g.69819 Transcript_32569/m.69819 type:complete len:676 (+) Transcript_32569:102-2129(+)